MAYPSRYQPHSTVEASCDTFIHTYAARTTTVESSGHLLQPWRLASQLLETVSHARSAVGEVQGMMLFADTLAGANFGGMQSSPHGLDSGVLQDPRACSSC